MKINGERILIFGDSLSHPGADNGPTITDITFGAGNNTSAPGVVLAANLLEGVDTLGLRAQAVRINARVGRSARSFFSNEGGASLITGDLAFRPTKVVVMLGTNDIDLGVTPAALISTKSAMAQIRDAYRSMGAEVFAIGPPLYLNDHYTQAAPAMLDAIREVFGADHTIEARFATFGAGRTPDGVHFTQSGAALAGKQLTHAIVAEPPAVVVTPDSSTLVLGALGLASVIGLSWLALRAAKRIAQRPGLGRRTLEAVDVKLIKRVAQLISYDVPKVDIHDQLIADGYTEDDVFQAHQAAKVYLRRRELPDANFGRAFRFGVTTARYLARRS